MDFDRIYQLEMTIYRLLHRLHLSSKYFGKNHIVYRYMKRLYRNFLFTPRLFTNDSITVPTSNKKIWIIWWQGINNMPPIVYSCYKSVMQNKGEFSLIVIDKDNYKDYINIPDHIVEKFNNGIISITHLSDYIRFALLNRWGGYYLDATIFVTSTLCPRDHLFSIKLPHMQHFISEAKWSSYLWYLPQDHILSKLFIEIYSDYWKRHNLLIDYFLVDHIIRLIYENNDSVKNEIDKLAIGNPDIFFFQGNNAYQKYNEEEWKLLKLRNQFFKCNWKCREKQVDGSFYDTILLKRLNK